MFRWRLMVLFIALTTGSAGCASSGRSGASRDPEPAPRATVFAEEDDSESAGLLGGLLGRSAPEAPPEPDPFGPLERSRPKDLTVPQDTINALKLMAGDWVVKARERGPRVRPTSRGTFVRTHDTFGDKYVLEIERAEPEAADGATLIGYVFLDSSHMRTAEHDTAEAAEADNDYPYSEERKLRLTFRLIERWEFSELAEKFVFNREWQLARVQFKPLAAIPTDLDESAELDVEAPQETPRN